MKSLKRKSPAAPVKPKSFRMTRAWVAGFIEGRAAVAGEVRCPYSRTQEKNEWRDGRQEGTAHRHFQNRTTPPDKKTADAVLYMRRETGERC